jgi:arylsulfatase A-like enzyme
VSLVDVAPTLCALLNLSLPQPVDGTDLTVLFRGEPLARTRVFTEYADKIHGVLTERYHYIHNPEGFTPQAIPFPTPEERRLRPELSTAPRFRVRRRELYDILDDPLEQYDLADMEQQTWRPLVDEIEAFRTGRKAVVPLRITDKEKLEALKRMGYVE